MCVDLKEPLVFPEILTEFQHLGIYYIFIGHLLTVPVLKGKCSTYYYSTCYYEFGDKEMF